MPYPDLSTARSTSGLVGADFDSRRAGVGAKASIGKRAELKSRLLSANELAGIGSIQWDALSENALVENPFYARSYLKGGLSTIDAESHISAFAVWSSDEKLVGLFPFQFFFGIGCGAHNIYQFSGAPLVHRDHADDVVHSWLLAIRSGLLPSCWQVPDLQLDGRLYDLICRTACDLGLSLAVVESYSRPQLTRLQGGFEAHLTQVLSKSRRKELERCLRRLREKGALRLDRANTPDTVQAALEDFLTLENAGWKNRAGTAFLVHRDDARFARAAFTNEGPGRGTIVDTLCLNDFPIAISVNITSGRTLFTPKCTYYEPLRSFAPGLVLEYLVIERFYRELDFARMDAATTADGHVVQGLWNETVPMGTLYVGSAIETAYVVLLARAKAALKPSAKLVRDYFRSAWRERVGRPAVENATAS